MEILIISLYLLQTFLGAVLWRKFSNSDNDDASFCFWWSASIVPNMVGLFILLFRLINWILNKVYSWIDSLAGKTKKIKCTGNNGKGCYLDNCGHNCGCEGIKN